MNQSKRCITESITILKQCIWSKRRLRIIEEPQDTRLRTAGAYYGLFKFNAGCREQFFLDDGI
jgi:hypothetical protein